MAWSAISSDGLWRCRRRYRHAAIVLGRAEGAGGPTPADAQSVGGGAAPPPGPLHVFVRAEGRGSADVLAEHPVQASESNPRPAATTGVCFIGRSMARIPSRRPRLHP